MTSHITLSNGTTIPQLGFGTFKIAPEDAVETVSTALDVGFRHIDTAQGYQNEAEVGEAIANSGLAREEVYVTSKLGNYVHPRDDLLRSFDETLEKLRLDKLDLFLMHWPLPTRYDGDFVSTWKVMLELVEDGRLTSAGVSNFEPAHLAKIIDATGVTPVVNQIELHPYFHNDDARRASQSHGIAVEAWGPLAKGEALRDAVVGEIAAEVDRAASQVVLRWHLQRGNIIFPKSMHRERMVENMQIFDFELTDGQIARIDSLDKGADGRQGPNPNTFAGM
ncbi:aldo/keto reductase [Demequina lutea]|uniref:2,5-diketo-D-gluconate reductase A n=1 Tax=Demequina lutea TaxID=431489 RepID=A0A7Z0CIL9_9MICO|nr:aldo/keto reductase [Demequina lutea]NYI42074.1 2,5-diketo-D-gluconate reductase A [Demequina lutea]